MLNVSKIPAKKPANKTPHIVANGHESANIVETTMPANLDSAKSPERGPVSIRKGIPMPASRNRGGVSVYPWSAMEAGDMFFVPNGKIETFYTLTANARKKYGKNFRAARLTEDGVEGVGVWCLEEV